METESSNSSDKESVVESQDEQEDIIGLKGITHALYSNYIAEGRYLPDFTSNAINLKSLSLMQLPKYRKVMRNDVADFIDTDISLQIPLKDCWYIIQSVLDKLNKKPYPFIETPNKKFVHVIYLYEQIEKTIQLQPPPTINYKKIEQKFEGVNVKMRFQSRVKNYIRMSEKLRDAYVFKMRTDEMLEAEGKMLLNQKAQFEKKMDGIKQTFNAQQKLNLGDTEFYHHYQTFTSATDGDVFAKEIEKLSQKFFPGKLTEYLLKKSKEDIFFQMSETIKERKVFFDKQIQIENIKNIDINSLFQKYGDWVVHELQRRNLIGSMSTAQQEDLKQYLNLQNNEFKHQISQLLQTLDEEKQVIYDNKQLITQRGYDFEDLIRQIQEIRSQIPTVKTKRKLCKLSLSFQSLYKTISYILSQNRKANEDVLKHVNEYFAFQNGYQNPLIVEENIRKKANESMIGKSQSFIGNQSFLNQTSELLKEELTNQIKQQEDIIKEHTRLMEIIKNDPDKQEEVRNLMKIIFQSEKLLNNLKEQKAQILDHDGEERIENSEILENIDNRSDDSRDIALDLIQGIVGKDNKNKSISEKTQAQTQRKVDQKEMFDQNKDIVPIQQQPDYQELNTRQQSPDVSRQQQQYKQLDTSFGLAAQKNSLQNENQQQIPNQQKPIYQQQNQQDYLQQIQETSMEIEDDSFHSFENQEVEIAPQSIQQYFEKLEPKSIDQIDIPNIQQTQNTNPDQSQSNYQTYSNPNQNEMIISETQDNDQMSDILTEFPTTVSFQGQAKPIKHCLYELEEYIPNNFKKFYAISKNYQDCWESDQEQIMINSGLVITKQDYNKIINYFISQMNTLVQNDFHDQLTRVMIVFPVYNSPVFKTYFFKHIEFLKRLNL